MPLPPTIPLQPLLALWALLAVGLGYAAWFRRLRAAWGFGLLAWVTAGCFSGEALFALGYAGGTALAVFAWSLVPWNLLFFSLLPERALRGWPGLAVAAMFGVQLGSAMVLLPGMAEVPSLDAVLLGLVPVPARSWLTPPGPLLCVLAAIVTFARWQLSEELTELALFAMATLLLVAVMLPQHGPVTVAVAAALLLGSLVILAHRMAFVDALTGLNNRRALEAALAALPARYAIAMLDIDHFKSINDRFGHDVGDQVLRMTASRLRQAGGFRTYRYGGEEFCLLFRGRRVAEARELCQRAREMIADPPMVIRSANRPDRRPSKAKRRKRDDAPGIKVTASIGLAFPRAGDRTAQTIEAADRALYRAKRGGRNRVNVVGKAPA